MFSKLFLALSLAGAASAQVALGSAPVTTPAPAVAAPAANAPSSDSSNDSYLQSMPYDQFKNGGYKQLNCGYGYSKGSDGSCQPESWWNYQGGCYETIIMYARYFFLRHSLD
jgi:hypothetical protein